MLENYGHTMLILNQIKTYLALQMDSIFFFMAFTAIYAKTR